MVVPRVGLALRPVEPRSVDPRFGPPITGQLKPLESREIEDNILGTWFLDKFGAPIKYTPYSSSFIEPLI